MSQGGKLKRTYFHKLFNILDGEGPETDLKVARASCLQDLKKHKSALLSDERLASYSPKYYSPNLEYPIEFSYAEYRVLSFGLLNEAFPDARWLYVTRNRHDQRVSTYAQYLRGGGCLELNEYLTKYQQRLDQLTDHEAVISMIESLVGKERLVVVSFDEIAAARSELHRKLSEWWPDWMPEFWKNERANPSPPKDLWDAIADVNKLLGLLLRDDSDKLEELSRKLTDSSNDELTKCLNARCERFKNS